jgi:hypothetical protein
MRRNVVQQARPSIGHSGPVVLFVVVAFNLPAKAYWWWLWWLCCG